MTNTARNKRINDLVRQLTEYDDAYYNTDENADLPIIDDAVYDALRDELRGLDPENAFFSKVGASVGASLEKVAHSIPMGSQEKAMNETEFRSFCNQFPSETIYTASLKMDGGSVSLEYVKGSLVRAVTRGDGLIGEDITSNVKVFQHVPTSNVKLNSKPFTGFVRGEIILTTENWKIADPTLAKNPRNLGNGMCRRKNGEGSNLLTIYAFRAHVSSGEEIAPTEAEMCAKLASMGFLVADYFTGSSDEIWSFFETIKTKRPSLPFWIDGVVVKIDNISLQKEEGTRDNRPKGQIAIKFPATGSETQLLGIVWTVGHTGAIIPTGNFKPVELGGTTVSNALLYNYDFIETMDLAVLDNVWLFKSGDIIPKVLKVTHRPADRIPIELPACCPACKGKIECKATVDTKKSKILICVNDICPAKVTGKLRRFIESLQIMGVGDEVLETLIQKLDVRTPADLYRLTQGQLEPLTIGDKNIRLGAKRAATIIASIQAKRSLTIPELIGSLGIEDLAVKRVEQVQEALPEEFANIEDWVDGKLALHAKEVGLPSIGERLSKALQTAKPMIEDLLSVGVKIIKKEKVERIEGALNICITGALSQPRSYYTDLLTSKGHVFKDGVTKDLNYLVMADPTSTSSKSKSAKKLGIPCIDEAALLKLLGV
jgi:DNA ligase (NAD+)